MTEDDGSSGWASRSATGSTGSLLRAAVELPDAEDFEFASRVRLQPGELLSDRFVVERLAARGGMGAVYRARDLATSAAAAIKVMESVHRHDRPRFLRETMVLAELSHPAIVAYLTHGFTALGAPFVAMEWLSRSYNLGEGRF